MARPQAGCAQVRGRRLGSRGRSRELLELVAGVLGEGEEGAADGVPSAVVWAPGSSARRCLGRPGTRSRPAARTPATRSTLAGGRPE
eukprot:8185403-Alexandrium_andersonii.AAC.1